MKATMLDMRRSPGKIIEAIERNETVILTRRGKDVAEITPLTGKPRQSIASNPAFGAWKKRRDLAKPSEWVRKVRKARFRDL